MTSQASGSVSSLCALLQHLRDFWAGVGLSLLSSEAEKSIRPALSRLGSMIKTKCHQGWQQLRFLDHLQLFQAAEYFK